MTASCRADFEAPTSLTSCIFVTHTHTHTHSVFLQPPSFSLHSELLHSPTRSSGSSSSRTVPPCSSGRRSRSSLPCAASARCPGPDAGPPLQHRSQGHPQLLSGIPGQYVQHAHTQQGSGVCVNSCRKVKYCVQSLFTKKCVFGTLLALVTHPRTWILCCLCVPQTVVANTVNVNRMILMEMQGCI